MQQLCFVKQSKVVDGVTIGNDCFLFGYFFFFKRKSNKKTKDGK